MRWTQGRTRQDRPGYAARSRRVLAAPSTHSWRCLCALPCYHSQSKPLCALLAGKVLHLGTCDACTCGKQEAYSPGPESHTGTATASNASLSGQCHYCRSWICWPWALGGTCGAGACGAYGCGQTNVWLRFPPDRCGSRTRIGKGLEHQARCKEASCVSGMSCRGPARLGDEHTETSVVCTRWQSDNWFS